MDFGPVSLNDFVGADDGAMASSSRGVPRVSCGMSSVDGSGLLIPSEQDWKDSKSISLADDPQLVAPTGILLRSTNSLLAAGQPTMLSFSSPNPLPTKNGAAPPYRSIPETPIIFRQQGGYGYGGSNGGMHGSFTRCKGPFTSSQWLELELQALIYKYILANVPIPSHLLIQIRKSLNPFLYVGSSWGSYAPSSIGWGTFHLGLSGSTYPEPGRCRRTDGKKWRCSREAVPDQKYCERHINRGRHRSRKPVEGHNGQVVAATTNTKVVPIASSPSASVMCSSGTSKSLGQTQHQFKSLQPTTANPSTNAVVNGMHGTSCQSTLSPIINLKSKDNPFSIPKQLVPIGGSSQPEFSVVSSAASLVHPSDKSSYINPRNCDSFLSFNDQETHHEQPLRHFMNDLPKNQSDCSTVSWPEEFKSDWTQLSVSIPLASCDFSSCSNSPCQEKFTLTPLSLPCELDSIDMSLGALNDPIKKPTNWIPVTRGNSMGGPLGEALNSTPSSVEANNKSSLVLNLMTEEWDGRLMTEEWNGCPQLGSSPTGVLQKATFVSVSNSSSGSSPRADYKASGSLSDDVPCLASTSSVAIPL